jgi:hypothetical protein
MLFEPENERFFMELGTYDQFMKYFSEMCSGRIFQYRKTKSKVQK